jgi:hypothetical protein
MAGDAPAIDPALALGFPLFITRQYVDGRAARILGHAIHSLNIDPVSRLVGRGFSRDIKNASGKFSFRRFIRRAFLRAALPIPSLRRPD